MKFTRLLHFNEVSYINNDSIAVIYLQKLGNTKYYAEHVLIEKKICDWYYVLYGFDKCSHTTESVLSALDLIRIVLTVASDAVF